MKRLIHIVLILAFAILFFPQFSFSQVRLSSERFEIHAPDHNSADELKNILESSYLKISEFLEDSLTAVVGVYVTETQEEFTSMVGDGFPDWGIGCAISSRNLIILKSPSRFEYHRPFAQVVTHELAHIFLGNVSRGGEVPRWLEEGFAMYQSQEWRIGQDVVVARAVLTGSALPLSQIESVNAFRESKARLAYTESFLAVSYLYGEYGEGTVKELATHLANGSSLDLAFMRTIGSSYLAFQLEFEKYIQAKYNWASIFGDTILIWIGLAFLIVFLYLFKRRRAKSKLEEWELEEQGTENGGEFPTDQT
jgi:hypothetical protein